MLNVSPSGDKSLILANTLGGLRSDTISLPLQIVDSIANILSLPVELKQNIALRLNSKDYASFRETCLAINQEVDSFSILNNKINFECPISKKRERISKLLLNQSVRMIMESKAWLGIKQVLKNVSVSKYRTSESTLLMSTVFSTQRLKRKNGAGDNENNCPYWVKESFMLFKNEMSEILEIEKVTAFRRDRNQKIFWVVGIAFKNEFIHYAQLKTAFINLNNAFNKASGAEKLIIAMITYELYSFLCQFPPHGLVTNDISESARGATDLLNTAHQVRQILADSTG